MGFSARLFAWWWSGELKARSDATLFAFSRELFANELTSQIGHDERWKPVLCEYACEMV